MKIPESLVDLCKKRIDPYPVEGFVYGGGSENAKLMLVGEAPGETEIHNGIPFSGRAGEQLMGFLERINLTREEVYITSAVRSRPFKWGEKRERSGEMIKRKYNRTPTRKEILAHAPILDYEIENVKVPIIVTLGNIGLKRLAGADKKISEVHGTLLTQSVQRLKNHADSTYEWSEQKYNVFPTYHPASIFYNRSLLDNIHADLDKLRTHLDKMK